MDSRVVLILLGTLVASGSALVCYKCSGTGDDCRKNVASMDNNTETCSSLQTRCATTYSKLSGDYVSFSRGCAVVATCVCGNIGGTGACVRCCKTDRCNTTSGSSTAQAQGVVALLAAAILSMLLSGKQ
ncbi:uncharacterized protein LOC144910398 [Branchiostoma floridae x Branchiostoma belcheri]